MNKNTKNKGFTLVELIVSMAIFLFIIGAAIGIFISIIQNQKKVLAEQQFLNQISYAEEYMSKALRMVAVDEIGDCTKDESGTKYPGFIYLLTRYKEASGLYRGIKFINQNGDDLGEPMCQEFYLDDDNILKEIKNAENPDSVAVPLISGGQLGIDIDSIKFSVNGMDGSANNCQPPCGATNSDGVQPRVTILMNVKIANDNQQPFRKIQTTVSQRNLNISNE